MKRLRLHALLTLIVLAECTVAWLLHASPTELEDRWQSGTPAERVAALHVLTNRDEPDAERFGQGLARSLLVEREPILRSTAFSIDVARLAFPRAQMESVLTGFDQDLTAEWFLDFVLQFRKVGGRTVGSGNAMSRDELDWYLDALASDRWTPAEETAIRARLTPLLEEARRYLDSR